MNNNLEIKIEVPNNPDCRIFNFNKRVNMGIYESLSDIKYLEKCKEQLGETATQMIGKIFEIKGIDSIGVNKYSISVMKARTFEWDDITSKIIDISTKALEGIATGIIDEIEDCEEDSDLVIMVESPGNPQCRVFHVNKRINATSYARFPDAKYLYEADNVGSLGTVLLKRLFYVEGVDEMSISKYSISIHKGYAFDWDDLIPQIKNIIRFVIDENKTNKKKIIDESIIILKRAKLNAKFK